MIKVALLTAKEAEEIQGKEFMPSCYFNPVLDSNNNYIISLDVVEQCNIDWIKKLPLIKFEPKKTDGFR